MTSEKGDFMLNYEVEYERWLMSPSLTETEKRELMTLSEDDKKIRFSSPLSFGTAGLRAKMYMGIGCINRFTVARATRAVAKTINSLEEKRGGIAIAYDSRNNSCLFARVAASVLASLGIRVYIFDGVRPTPELSFAVLNLSLDGGINITASHNPKEYNGYKVYASDGAQIGPLLASRIAETMDDFDVLDVTDTDRFDELLSKGLITVLGEEFDEKYLSAVLSTSISPEYISECKDSLKVVYTPLHGAGYRLVPEILRRAGLSHLYTVEEQMTPNGDFPTVEKPNPEYPEVFNLGIKLADKVGSDIVIATDPDADRIGVMQRGKDGNFKALSGNEIGVLLLDYVILSRKKKGTLTDTAYCAKSIVSTDMAYKIASQNGVRLHDVLTGFKYIGETINSYTDRGIVGSFLLGFEESYGYLMGEYARDKDAVGAALMIIEMTSYHKTRGKTLFDALEELYALYGRYSEKTVDVYMDGVDGVQRREKIMNSLRKNPPKSFGGHTILSVADYLNNTVTRLVDESVGKTGQPESDVLYYTLRTGDKVIVRPSGTEPKIKIYMLLSIKSEEDAAYKAFIYSNEVKKLMEI